MESQSYSFAPSTTITTYLPSCLQENDNKSEPPPPLPPSSFRSTLHSVRKLPLKPCKKPIAPYPPTPPRIYQVDAVNFKQVVQSLTAAPEFQPRRLQMVAPPPLSLSTTMKFDHAKNEKVAATMTTLELLPSDSSTSIPSLANTYRELMSETTVDYMQQPCKQSEGFFDAVNYNYSPQLGFGLPPTSNNYGWCSIPLLSPGTLSSLEQSTVL